MESRKLPRCTEGSLTVTIFGVFRRPYPKPVSGFSFPKPLPSHLTPNTQNNRPSGFGAPKRARYCEPILGASLPWNSTALMKSYEIANLRLGANGMSTLAVEAKATAVWFDDQSRWIQLSDGRSLSVPLTYFPRLLNASSDARADFIISGGGTGLHWEQIDEDISVVGLLLGVGDRTAT